MSDIYKREPDADIRALIENFRSVDNSELEKKWTEEYLAIEDNPDLGCVYAGSDAEHCCARYVWNTLREMGVKAEMLPLDAIRYQYRDSRIRIVRGEGYEGEDWQVGPYIAPATPEAGVEGELVCVNQGKVDDLWKNDISGKIILVEFPQGIYSIDHTFIAIEAAKLGAIGVIFCLHGTYDDDTLRTQHLMDIPPIPIVGCTVNQAKKLHEMLAKAKVVLNIKVDSEIKPHSVDLAVIGEIPGDTNPDERIVFSAHMDHFFKCAQDNVSSVVAELSIAKKMMESGYKPSRTITFMFATSHETGHNPMHNPLHWGSFQILHKLKPEWSGKVVSNINFEYVALHQQELRAYGSYEMIDTYENYIRYGLNDVKGFDGIAQDVREEDYYFATMSDSCSFIASGMPVIMNDPISEQWYQGTGPYVGCDHSTADNMRIYDFNALKDNVNWYGGFAIYLDQIPIPEMNFCRRLNGLELNEEEVKAAEEAGIADKDILEYTSQLHTLKIVGEKLGACIVQANLEAPGYNSKNQVISSRILDIYKDVSWATEPFGSLFDFGVAHKKHIRTIQLLMSAKEQLMAGDLEKAIDENLLNIDMLAMPYNFGEACGRYIEKEMSWKNARICGKFSSTLVLTDLMVSLHDKRWSGDKDLSKEIADLEKAIQSERAYLAFAIDNETKAYKKICDKMTQCIDLF